jgi:hypothetical protein
MLKHGHKIFQSKHTTRKVSSKHLEYEFAVEYELNMKDNKLREFFNLQKKTPENLKAFIDVLDSRDVTKSINLHGDVEFIANIPDKKNQNIIKIIRALFVRSNGETKYINLEVAFDKNARKDVLIQLNNA